MTCASRPASSWCPRAARPGWRRGRRRGRRREAGVPGGAPPDRSPADCSSAPPVRWGAMGARMQGIAVQALLVLPALVFWPGARDAFVTPPWALAGVLAAAGFIVWLIRGAPGWSALPRSWRRLAGGWLGWLAVRVIGSVD